ncbi:MAG: hypothetical protein PF489_15155 [Salinivirgaceae bacterium]|jgi:myosin heavy subunit|nr:hypothetical protein [Salinivirgaceae bacterium]
MAIKNIFFSLLLLFIHLQLLSQVDTMTKHTTINDSLELEEVLQAAMNENEPDSVLNCKHQTDSLVKLLEKKSEQLKYIEDSLTGCIKRNRTLHDSAVLRNTENILIKDSIRKATAKLDSMAMEQYRVKRSRAVLADSLVQLHFILDSLDSAARHYYEKTKSLQPLNEELSSQIELLQSKIDDQGAMLNEQIEKIREKEQLFAEKEQIYQKAIQESKIDLVKLQGQLQSKNSELHGKGREIELLAQSIEERKQSIEKQNQEIDAIRQRREKVTHRLDTLRNYLQETEKELIVTKEKLKYAEQDVSRLKKQIHDLTNKKKTIRLVQGMAIRNFRTPLYSLNPESSDNPDEYVISNENGGDYEFDFVTGATFRLLDIGSDEGKFTSDVGFFMGFGGKNLFKNFYIGPNIKLFDVIHINAGLNIAEFRMLKSGFNEGDRVPQGTSIPTVSEWKLSPYFGLTFDFSLITSIAGKL